MKYTDKRAWIYTRIDAPEDAHGVLKKQEKELYDYAEQMGMTVTGTSSDLGSGNSGLAAMLKTARDGGFDILIAMRSIVLGRNATEAMDVLRRLILMEIQMFSPKEGRILEDVDAPWGIQRMKKEIQEGRL